MKSKSANRNGEAKNPPPHQKPVLIVTHRRETDTGSIGQWLRAHRVPLDIRRPRFGDPLPDTLEDHGGAIIFGGPMSANDPDGYIKREIDWIGVPLAEGKPFLGICLGAQMLAKRLGGAIYSHHEGRVEAGYAPIAPEKAAFDLGTWPSHVYHWHNEGFTLAGGMEPLARGEVFENQAFRYSPCAFGVQFHPEITLAMIHRWTCRAASRLSQAGVQAPKDQLTAHMQHGARMRTWTFAFLERWLGCEAAKPGGKRQPEPEKRFENQRRAA